MFPHFFFQFDDSFEWNKADSFIKKNHSNLAIVFSPEFISNHSSELISSIISKNSCITGNIFNPKETILSENNFDFIIVSNTDFDRFIDIKIPNKKIVVSFEIQNPGQYTPSLIDQLKNYFQFTVKYPQYTCAVFTDLSLIEDLIGFLGLMNKIGLRHFITPYDECADKLKTDSLQFLFQNNNAIPDVSTVLQLEKLRGKADHLDEKVIEILSERKKLVEQMSQIKKQKNLPIFDPQRWNEILRSRKRSGKEKMLDEELIEKIFEAIHLGNIKSMLSDEE